MQINKLTQNLPMPLKHLANKARQVSAKLETELRTLTAQIHPIPILVLGNQKSGTSAIAALLGEMTGLPVTIDLKKEIRNPTYQRIKTGELSFAEFVRNHKLDFANQIVKEPNLTLFYPELAEYFPKAKFVFIIRDPRDNIRSILNRLKVPGNLTELTSEYRGEITYAWDLIIDNQWLGLAGENYIEMMATRWNYTADVYLNNRDKIIFTKYEDFLKDKIGEINRLAQNLDLIPVNDISNKVDVQFQPRGNRNVKLQEFFGQDNLSRIERICGERMKLFDYPFSAQG